MQPQKAKKLEGFSLLERLRLRHPVELGMELQGFQSKYLLEGTVDKKILVSCNGDFIGSAQTISTAIDIIAGSENRKNEDYDRSKIETTYIVEDEVIETKIREECMPKKFSKKTGIEVHGKRFYIVKKKPNGTSSGKISCLYNFDTRNLIWAHWDRDILIGFLYSRYKEIEDKDI